MYKKNSNLGGDCRISSIGSQRFCMKSGLYKTLVSLYNSDYYISKDADFGAGQDNFAQAATT